MHAHHRVVDTARNLWVATAEERAELHRHDLPRHAEGILQPAAVPLGSTTSDEAVAQAVNFLLGLDGDEEGDGVVEVVVWPSIEELQRRAGNLCLLYTSPSPRD